MYFYLQFLEDSSKQGAAKQLPTTKWKRDRRTRPEYSRKSDPKIPEVFNQDQSEVQNYNGQQVNGGSSNPVNQNNTSNQVPSNNLSADIPLDMSLRQRGQPPSYAQTISNPGYRSSYRPTVITQTPPPHRDDAPSGLYSYFSWKFNENNNFVIFFRNFYV